MTSGQIILYFVIGLMLFMYLRKFMMMKSIKQYTPAELSERLQEKSNIVLLDVRSASERQQNHIKGSLHIPLHDIQGRIKELERYKEQEIVCYCLSGSRSVMAASKLRKLGYQVANLKGGFSEWNFYHR